MQTLALVRIRECLFWHVLSARKIFAPIFSRAQWRVTDILA